MIKELTPPEAWEEIQKNSDAVLLDVRTSMEYEYVGHVPGSVFVPIKEPPGWPLEGEFVDRVTHVLEQVRPNKDPRDLTILALCRSGARSMMAAEMLTAAGFREAINVAEGFEGDRDANMHRSSINGWRFHGLPWAQG